MDEFRKNFTELSNRRLITILEDADKYNKEAVEAAKWALSLREVPEEEVRAIKAEFRKQQAKIAKRRRYNQKMEKKAQAKGLKLWQLVDPLFSDPTAKRIDKLIPYVLGGLSIFQFFQQREALVSLFKVHVSEMDTSSMTLLLVLVLLPLSVFLFWKRYRLGWVLLVAYLVYRIFQSFISLFLAFEWENTHFVETDNPLEIWWLFLETQPLIYQADLPFHVLTMIVFGVVLYGVIRKSVMRLYKVKWPVVAATIVVALSLSFVATFLA